MNKQALMAITSVVAMGLTSFVHADDIEIYEGAIGDGVDIETQPNVMFILDTSGSMTGVVASESLDYNYDPDIDYGDDGEAVDDDYIYAYEVGGGYTGVYFTRDQVVCEAMLDQIDSNPGTPIYLDQTLQWQAEIETVGGTTTCTGDAEGEEEIVASNVSVTNGDASYIMGPVDASTLAEGSDLIFDIDLPERGRVDYAVQYFTTTWQSTSCTGNPGGMNGGSDYCTVGVDTLPGTATQVRVQIDEADNGPDTSTFDATFTYTKAGTQVCTTTGGTDTYVAEWSDALELSSETDWVLECEGDDGEHGLVNAIDPYVAYCPDDACTSPNYTSNASAGVNWASAGIDSYNFYNGNYHDFQQSSTAPDIEDLSVQDPDTYCEGSTNGDYFVDDDDVVYQCQRKWEIMEAAMSDIAASTNDINVGLMRFFDVDESDDNGGSVILALDDLDAELSPGYTQRDAIDDELDGLEYRTTTPLSETMYEAYRYFSGLSPVYDDSSIADPNAVSGGNYVAPIAHSCQSNNIVYLTDGSPVSDGSADSSIESIIGSSCSGNCLDELAGYMANNDLLGSTEGDDTVNTYTIGFDIDLDLLEDTAAAGNGTYTVASNYAELMETFQEIIINIALTEPATLVAPAVSVNAFNELQHREQIFYAVFKPEHSPKWNGNIKKYRLENGSVVDQNGTLAVDASTGFFDDEAVSYWSNITDGSVVDIGGVREQITANRRVYVEGNVLATPQAGIVQLTDSLELSQTAAGAATAGEATSVRDWILGIDVDDSDTDNDFTDANQFLAESLHSKPFVVTYSGSSEADAKDVLFFTTNAGFLHAVDATGGGSGDVSSGGTELWSYIPSDLVENATAYLSNTSGEDHVYGIDGEATVYTEESSTSSSSAFELETVKIYQGMRRGGQNYYAWDVSDALESGVPITEDWMISGGAGGFADLGQTWSQMLRTQISYGCDENGDGCSSVDALVFSGGYDTYYDDETVFPVNTANPSIQGNSLYIVNAETGALLWSAGGDGGHDLTLPMYNSIPATPTPVDIDGDGDLDMLFAIDISGKIWRMDFDQTANDASDYAQGGVIADLGDTTTSGYLRFYNPLDVSVTMPNDDYPYFNLVVGSGYRAHPKDSDEPTNRLFVVYDENVLDPKDDDDDGVYEYGYTSSDDVVSFANNDLYAASDSNPAEKGQNAVYGFYLTLPETDEKILNQTLTFNGRVVVTSYLPEAGSAQSSECGASGNTGGGNVYVIDLLTGETIFSTELTVPGIPPEASTILTDDGLTVCIGTECDAADDDFDFDDPAAEPDNVSEALGFDPGTALRTFWRQQ